jgi:hypothetical protein
MTYSNNQNVTYKLLEVEDENYYRNLMLLRAAKQTIPEANTVTMQQVTQLEEQASKLHERKACQFFCLTVVLGGVFLAVIIIGILAYNYVASQNSSDTTAPHNSTFVPYP